MGDVLTWDDSRLTTVDAAPLLLRADSPKMAVAVRPPRHR
jgi:hypothetical protein